jgi:hypothetical protein
VLGNLAACSATSSQVGLVESSKLASVPWNGVEILLESTPILCDNRLFLGVRSGENVCQ